MYHVFVTSLRSADLLGRSKNAAQLGVFCESPASTAGLLQRVVVSVLSLTLLSLSSNV